MRKLGKVVSEIVLVCAVFYGSGTAVLADGCYFPDRAVKKLPEIPTQRALLTWKDGTETLVISSALDSEAQKLGWLIPLPSVPREMVKADPGALKTLAFCVQPRITHDLSQAARALTLVIGWVILAAIVAAFSKERLIDFLVWSLLLLVLSGMLLPALSTAGGTASATIAKVRIEKTAKVGAYDIAVLTARSAAELNEWLSSNGFSPLPVEAVPMTADYIRKGWVFAAIKLTRTESGANAPHPIKLVFSSQEPVYPWKLTTLAGGRPLLELFVVGPSRAGVGGLKTEFCQRLTIRSRSKYELGHHGWVLGCEVFKAEQADVAIGHSEIMPLLWDGCVLTKLSGYPGTRRQAEDLPVNWTEFSAYQQHFYSTTAARCIAWIVFVSILGIVCTPGLLVCCRSAREYSRRFFFRRFLPWMLLLALSAAAITYVCLPKLGASNIQVIHHSSIQSFRYKLENVIERVVGEEPDLPKQGEPAIPEAILNRLPAMMSARLANPLQGGGVQLESSPGNFTIEKRDGKIVVRVYDQTGCPLLVNEY